MYDLIEYNCKIVGASNFIWYDDQPSPSLDSQPPAPRRPPAPIARSICRLACESKDDWLGVRRGWTARRGWLRI